jgi:Fe2+ or Zn2+ uptake regulation protein
VERAEGIKQGVKAVIRCNCCGKALKVENGILKEDAFEATKEWGYFSKRDLEIHHFNLCEECYDRIISGFQIPVEVRNKTEAM